MLPQTKVKGFRERVLPFDLLDWLPAWQLQNEYETSFSSVHNLELFALRGREVSFRLKE